ncbi:MAG: hypothetical protein MHMPM18_004352, partial [Marteilia pararefringens]
AGCKTASHLRGLGKILQPGADNSKSDKNSPSLQIHNESWYSSHSPQLADYLLQIAKETAESIFAFLLRKSRKKTSRSK